MLAREMPDAKNSSSVRFFFVLIWSVLFVGHASHDSHDHMPVKS